MAGACHPLAPSWRNCFQHGGALHTVGVFDQFPSSASQEEALLLSRAPCSVQSWEPYKANWTLYLSDLAAYCSPLRSRPWATPAPCSSLKGPGVVLLQGLSTCCSLSINHLPSRHLQASFVLLPQILFKSHYTWGLSLATL